MLAAWTTTARSRPMVSTTVHYDVALAPRCLLADVVAPRPAFSVVLTLWLSMMAALGMASRPSFSRTWPRSASSTRSQVPSARHFRKYRHTVPQGGRSWGTIRHGMPPRKTYSMPFTTSRRSAVRRRPLLDPGGNKGSKCFHWQSVKSLGYAFRFMPQRYSLSPVSHQAISKPVYNNSHTPSKAGSNGTCLRRFLPAGPPHPGPPNR